MTISHIETLHALAIAVEHLDASKAKASGPALVAVLACISRETSDDLISARKLLECFDNEDDHRRDGRTARQWLYLCADIGLQRALVGVLDGAEVVIVDGRAGLRKDGRTTLAPR